MPAALTARSTCLHEALRQLGVARLHQAIGCTQMAVHPATHGLRALGQRLGLAAVREQAAAWQVAEVGGLQQQQNQLAQAPLWAKVGC